jgi:hypothetical protein
LLLGRELVAEGLRLTHYHIYHDQTRDFRAKDEDMPPQLTLHPMEGTFAICKLGNTDAIPEWALAGEFVSITRTADELSIVCSAHVVPEGIVCERGWRCLHVAGAMPFSVVGVLASITAPLAEAGISIFAISTFDTDYLLVKELDFPATANALKQFGHTLTT